MRRFIAACLAILALVVLHHTQSALAIGYPAGWNLVAGPEGSHVIGATGQLYTLQPSDTDYEIFPVDSALHAGWGYWAYFPSGGSLQAAPGLADYIVTLVPGQLTMIGNPSSSTSVAVSGADVIYTYTPGGGYLSSATIPPGQGAWVEANGAVELTAYLTAGAAPPAIITPQQAAAIQASAFEPASVPAASSPRPGAQPAATGTRVQPSIPADQSAPALSNAPAGMTPCNDGTASPSTGSGTCSGHGGVAGSSSSSGSCFRTIDGRRVYICH